MLRNSIPCSALLVCQLLWEPAGPEAACPDPNPGGKRFRFPTIALPVSAQHFPERCWGSGTWLWGSHLDKLLRPGILSLQSTDPTLDQPEAFSVGELPNILLVFAFCAVFCALGLPLFILEAAADKFSLSEFSQDAPYSCS